MRLLTAFLPLLLLAGTPPTDPVAYVEARLAAGERMIVVPKGDYRLSLTKDRAAYFRFIGLHGVTVDFCGGRLWGEVKSRIFHMRSCTNLTVRNVIVDYPFNLPFTQAEIVSVDAEQSWVAKIVPGYPCPEGIQIDPVKGRVWPIQAYDHTGSRLVNPMRFRNDIRVDRLGKDVYRISGGIDRRGSVGDIAVWSVGEFRRKSDNAAFCLEGCAGCVLEDCTVFSTPMGCAFVELGASRNTYRRCRLDRCPPAEDPVERGMKRLRSGNHDAFNSRRSFRGPLLDGCSFAWHCDDDVNISGFYGIVTRQDGRTVRVCPYGGLVPCSAGDRCQVMTADGAGLPDVTAVSCELDGPPSAEEQKMFAEQNFWPGIVRGMTKAYRVVLDSDVELPRGSVVISNSRQGNDFVIRNCRFGPNRARGLLVKASNGVIEGNTIFGVEGHGIMISSEYQWLEGGCSRHIKIADNILIGNGGGMIVAGNDGKGKPLKMSAHRDMLICGNRVESESPALKVVGCTNLVISNNVFDVKGGRRIELVNCENVKSDEE